MNRCKNILTDYIYNQLEYKRKNQWLSENEYYWWFIKNSYWWTIKKRKSFGKKYKEIFIKEWIKFEPV